MVAATLRIRFVPGGGDLASLATVLLVLCNRAGTLRVGTLLLICGVHLSFLPYVGIRPRALRCVDEGMALPGPIERFRSILLHSRTPASNMPGLTLRYRGLTRSGLTHQIHEGRIRSLIKE